MKDRKNALFSAIINEHINTGNTVASKVLVDKYDFALSPATIRNEMADLEKEGLIFQPHTSAGRIPTEKGWKFYIENLLKDAGLAEKHQEVLDKAFGHNQNSYDSAVKSVAKVMANLSKEAVFVGFDSDSFYYTGLSNLFRQPEFQKIDLVCQISDLVDHLDEVVGHLFSDQESDQEKILVGRDNPFGKDCSSIMAYYTFGKKKKGLFGILGPVRMNYTHNLSLIKYAKKLFASA